MSTRLSAIRLLYTGGEGCLLDCSFHYCFFHYWLARGLLFICAVHPVNGDPHAAHAHLESNIYKQHLTVVNMESTLENHSHSLKQFYRPSRDIYYNLTLSHINSCSKVHSHNISQNIAHVGGYNHGYSARSIN